MAETRGADNGTDVEKPGSLESQALETQAIEPSPDDTATRAGKRQGQFLQAVAPGALVVAVLLACLAVEFWAALTLNSGHFVFTLDDPYIHLALAENLRLGHYGLNLQEPSAPSSSILWPFLITPIAGSPAAPLIILFLNALMAAITLLLFRQVVLAALSRWEGPAKQRFATFLTVLLIPATNLVGLVFTGMEHSLQLVCTALVLLGLVRESGGRGVTWWLLLGIVVGPLVRYENLAISVPALLYLIARRRLAAVAVCGAVLGAAFAGFSLFLHSQGLPALLPSSVTAKSGLVSPGEGFLSIFVNPLVALTSDRGVVLALCLVPLTWAAFSSGQSRTDKLLSGVMILAIALHLMSGEYGWFSRYEVYIWSASLLSLIYLYRRELVRLAQDRKRTKAMFVLLLLVAVCCAPYFYVLVETPLASNNIYEQQYQMHRFVVDYLRGPVAVHDIGYVSYRNDEYVLDLGGLASPEALSHRKNEDDPQWMEDMMQRHEAEVAILYDEWFPDVPESWVAVATMALGNARITASESEVTFYVANAADLRRVRNLLEEFRDTLPEGVQMEFRE